VELSLLILVCIYKSYIVYLEIYVVPIGHGFSFLVMEKSWKINVGKMGAPWNPHRCVLGEFSRYQTLPQDYTVVLEQRLGFSVRGLGIGLELRVRDRVYIGAVLIL